MAGTGDKTPAGFAENGGQPRGISKQNDVVTGIGKRFIAGRMVHRQQGHLIDVVGFQCFVGDFQDIFAVYDFAGIQPVQIG